jgi:putative spermidine/putrescine transport system ATP-binding protein
VAAHPVTSLKLASRAISPDPEPSAAGWRGARLHARRGGTAVLDGLSLDLDARGRLALLGPRGAGKTAALMLLAGFARPDAGEILLGGRTATDVPPHRRDLGVVFQDDALLPHLTLSANVAFPLVARGIRREAHLDRVGWALEAFALAGLGERRPRDLDGEQRIRAALARAVVGHPKLLLLDDPCAGLDGMARAVLLRDVCAAAAAIDAALLIATRDPADALALGGRVAVLLAGGLQQYGAVQAVYDRPFSAPVARLLGEANLLPGLVEAIEEDIARVRLACGVAVEALAHAGMGPGHPCVVFVRPERIAVAASDAADMGERAIPAEMVSVEWRGDHVRLVLRIGADDTRPATLLVKRPAGALLSGLAPGEKAAVAWQPHHARVLPRED